MRSKNRLLGRINLTLIGKSLSVLSKNDRKKILIVTCMQVFLGFLDLLGVAVIGVLGALAVNGIQSKKPGNRVSAVLETLHIEGLAFQNQIAVLGILAAIFLISRTILSIYFSRRILYFLSRKSADISSKLIAKLLSQDLLQIQSRSTQDTLFSVTSGVNAMTIGVIAVLVNLFSDISVLVLMSLGLFLVDPIIAISTFLLFGIIGFLLYKLMHLKAARLGQENSSLNIKSNEKILEVLNSYRESVVRNRRFYYSRIIREARLDLANNQAEMSFMPSISKYVLETTVVMGSIAICASQFLLNDATHAVATLSVFLAAGTRIAPAVLRVQQGAVGIKNSLGVAQPTFSLLADFKDVADLEEPIEIFDIEHRGFIGSIEISNLTFCYPGNNFPAVTIQHLNIPTGSLVAFVGPSGAGKTTTIDLILGVLKPDSGTITISGMNPDEVVKEWPGAMSYVPQDVIISNGTIRENVSLGFPAEIATDKMVWRAIKLAQLEEMVLSLELKLDSRVGERGTKISGGQRQRLGIARGLFTKPKLLVLDEATSSLDGLTESEISEAIQGLKGEVTIVIIAHRLSTVRFADIVVYMENGKVIASGKFDLVRNLVPEFDKQAKLMGL